MFFEYSHSIGCFFCIAGFSKPLILLNNDVICTNMALIFYLQFWGLKSNAIKVKYAQFARDRVLDGNKSGVHGFSTAKSLKNHEIGGRLDSFCLTRVGRWHGIQGRIDWR